MDSSQRTPGLVRYVATSDRRRTLFAIVMLSIGGILEGFGIAVFLPVLESMMSTQPADDGLAATINGLLVTVGLPPTIEVQLAIFVALFIVRGAFLYVAALFAGLVVARVVMDLRLRLLRAITQAEWKHTLSYPSGYIANAVSSEAVRTGIAYNEFAQLVAEGSQVIVYLSMVFLVSWKTGVAAVLVGVGILVMLHGRVKASGRAGRDQVHVLRSVLARLTDALPSLKPLKAMGREQYLLPLLEQETRAYYEGQKRELASTELVKKAREPIIMAALALGLWAVVGFTSIGTTSIMILAALFYRTVTSITNMQQRWVTVTVGDHAFRSLMEHVTLAEAAREHWPAIATPPPLERGLELKDLRFAYGDNEVLHGVSAELPAGAFVVLSGPSGGGKSTLTDLITGLLRPTGGRVLIDGIDLADVDITAWRRRIGYVPQEPMLFSDSVMNNITLRDATFSRERVEEALRAAGAWDFVNSLPDGLDQRIGEGGIALSGGQRQRIAIARALVIRPALLILDEPTAALDAASEREVCQTLGRLRGKLTMLAVTHRPALRDFADVIWELDDGRLTIHEVAPTLHAAANARA